MSKTVDKEIFKLAIPNIVSNISVPLLSTVDTVLMGRLSVEHLAAVGVGSMIFNMLYWNFGFLRMGTTGMTAQAFGSEEVPKMATVLGRGLLLASIIAVVILLFSGPLLSLCQYLFNVSGDATEIVRDYYAVRIWAAPATLILYVLMGWLFGMQNAVYPLIGTIAINIVNIAISYYCVTYLSMEAKGVALGTVIAQYFGVLLLSLGILFKYGKVVAKIKWKAVLVLSELAGFLKINSDIFIRTACLTFVFSFFYSQSFKLGALVLAVNVILQQFINWMSYGIDGFAYASESLIGKYKGAANQEYLLQTTKRSFVWGGVTAILFAAVFVFFGNDLLYLFSSDLEAICLADGLLYFVWLFPLIGFASYIWDGIYVGLLASKTMRNAMLLALLVFLLTFFLIPVYEDGTHIWIALSAFMIARGLIQTIYYIKDGFEME